MMMNRKWMWILIAVFAAGILFYIAKGRPRRLTIAIHESIEGDALREIAKRFSNKYKIEVQVLEFSYDELYEKEMAQVQKQDTSQFDVIMVDDPWLPALAGGMVDGEGNSHLKSLDVRNIDLSDFPDATLGVAKYCPHAPCKNIYYGLPFVGNTQLFCYRTAVFPRPEMVPATWDAVVEFVKNKRNQPGTQDTRPYVGRIGPGNSIVTDFVSVLWSHDAKAFPEALTDKPLTLGSKGKAALDDLHALVGGQNGSTSVDDFDLAAYMLKEKASMGIVWSAWAMMLENLRSKEQLPTLKFTPLPSGSQNANGANGPCRVIEGRTYCSTPELGVWLLAVPGGSGLQAEAEEFIQFATSQEQILRAALNGNPPPRISVLRDAATIAHQIPDLANQAVYDQLDRYQDSFVYQLDALKHARPRPRTPRWREVECILGKYLAKVAVENMDTTKAVEKVNSVLENCTANSAAPCADPPECHADQPLASAAQN